MNNKDGNCDDTCGEVASDAFIDSVVLQRHVDDRQVTDVLQCPRGRWELTKYLHSAACTQLIMQSAVRQYYGTINQSISLELDGWTKQ